MIANELLCFKTFAIISFDCGFKMAKDCKLRKLEGYNEFKLANAEFKLLHYAAL